MVETVVFQSQPTGVEAPASEAPAAVPENLEKALKDTKAELTRAQQELAELRKAAQPAPDTEAKPETPTPDSGDAAPKGAEPGDATDEEAAKAVEAAGLDVAPWQAEFDTTGDVSAEGREKLAEGLKAVLGEKAREYVDAFVDNQKVRRDTQLNELFDAGGGREEYPAMLQWAAQNLTKEEVAKFDSLVDSGDHNAALFAIRGLRSRYEASNGREPKLISGGQPPAAPSGFRSAAEMVLAMSDPRYKTDPAYRKDVEAKVVRSTF